MSGRYDDAMGDSLKALEAVETERRVAPGECVMVRVDGMAFSNFTSAMAKPYDAGMATVMKATAEALLNAFSPAFVYTQSDEITLVFSPDKIPFDGRLQKIATACAGKATSFFRGEITKLILDHVESVAAEMSAAEAIALIRGLAKRDEKLAPAFDGRAISVTPEMAAQFLVWREIDARRNGALGAGRGVFTQAELGGKSPGDIKDMLLATGIDYYEEYNNHFRRGTLMRKRQVEMTLTEEELMRIPEHVRESKRKPFIRFRVVEVEDRPPLYMIENITEFAFNDEEPVVEDRPFARHIHP